MYPENIAGMRGSDQPPSMDVSPHFFICVLAPPASGDPLWRSDPGGGIIFLPSPSQKTDD